MEKISQLLIGYRAKNSLTQKELAKQLGVPRLRIIEWEGEKSKPSKVNEYKIKEFLKDK